MKFVAELVGTFAFCLVGGGSILAAGVLGLDGPHALLGIAVAHGLMLSIAITATMNISGGHINPAVTIAMLTAGKIGVGGAMTNIAGQIIGGCLGGYVLGAVFFTGMSQPDGNDVISAKSCGTPTFDVTKLTEVSPYAGRSVIQRSASRPAPASDESGAADGAGAASEPDPPIRALPPLSMQATKQNWFDAAKRATAIEGVLTFLLVFSVFCTAVDPRAPKIGGFGVGLTVAACVLAGGVLTGAGMNPARVIGTGFLLGSEFWVDRYGWLVYIVGPVAGAVFAAIVYKALLAEKKPAAN